MLEVAIFFISLISLTLNLSYYISLNTDIDIDPAAICNKQHNKINFYFLSKINLHFRNVT